MTLSRLRQNRLLLQLLFTLIAAASLAAISILVITDAIRSAERVVVGETKRTLAAALSELQRQEEYQERSAAYWSSLPQHAKDVSLRNMTDTVLRSYPGVEGGFYAASNTFLGYAYPTHDTGSVKTDVPAAESKLIMVLAQRSMRTPQRIEQVIRGKMDLLVLAAVRGASPTTAVWVMKRLPSRVDPNGRMRGILLGILVVAALASIAGTLATGIGLARGVSQIKIGLAALEQDFDYRLPERPDELGTISRAINRMAGVRRRLESDLRREDRLRAVGRLASGLAHEIRNPLNSIRLTVQLLENRLNSGRLREADLKTVRTEVDRLSALINDLLDLQRTRQPVLKFQPVMPVVNHCCDLLQRQAEVKGVRLQSITKTQEVFAFFDAPQLTQTVMNLLLNALEASKEGDTVQIQIADHSGAVTVQVRDTGPGLNTEQQDHLFEPFYTTKPSGTGLGLAVSRELMRSQ
ncbi:MAG: HAMP domain-containing protein, partial [Acidobacteriaceae bacterium]|nr:HAMP domain-containing protein [Acidobacteriaceae bacterium]